MAEQNRYGLSRNIPSEVKRKVRQRDGFGCVVCGFALIEYEHFNPEFKDARSHNPDGIILLCPSCHSQKGRFLSHEKIARHAATPYCKTKGFANGPFDFGNGHPEIVLGTFKGRNVPVLLRVLGEDIFSILPPEQDNGPFRLNATLRDVDGHETIQIVDNEWQINSLAWDASVEGKRITIRRALGDIALMLRSEPPTRIVIERLNMTHRGIQVSCPDGKNLMIRNDMGANTFCGGTVEGCDIGIEIGERHISIGVYDEILHRKRTNNKSNPSRSNQIKLQQFYNMKTKITIKNPCFCRSGLPFEMCHGKKTEQR